MKRLIISLAAAVAMVSCSSQDKLTILTCGIRHESNTFSTITTGPGDFEVLRGEEVLAAGQPWCRYLQEEGIKVIPTLHAYAWPGGTVTKEAYDSFKSEILERIRKAGKIDGIYMDMHGALHVQGMDDAQVDLIKAIRDIVGEDVAISASFDLHGNVSDGFASELDFLTAYRTAPHRDGAETKLRAVKNLVRILREDLHPEIARVEIPILVPGEKSITEVEPLNSIYSRLPEIENTEGIMDASVFVGYAWADLPRSAMRVFVVAEDSLHAGLAEELAAGLAEDIWNVREKMVLDVESGDIGSMLEKAYSMPQKTVFISDSGDNTTAGAPGDNPQVIQAMVESGCKNALFAGLVDPEAFKACLDAGKGAELTLALGGKKDNVFGKPFVTKVKVLDFSDEKTFQEGRGIVLVEAGDVQIALLDRRNSFTTVQQFKDIHLDPLSFKVVVVKLGYLYPELRDIAPAHLMALTSGFCNLDMTSLPFSNVRRPSYPLDPDMDFHPDAHVFF